MRRQIPHFSWEVPGRETCQSSDNRVCSNTPHTYSSRSGAPRDAEEMSANTGTGAAETAASLAAFRRWKQLQNGDLPLAVYVSLGDVLHFSQPRHQAIRRRLHRDSEPSGFQARQGKDGPKRFLTSNFSRNRGLAHSSWSGGSAGSRSPHCRNSSISQYSWRNRPPHAAFLTLPNSPADVRRQMPRAGTAGPAPSSCPAGSHGSQEPQPHLSQIQSPNPTLW